MVCPTCNEPLVDGARFCMRCGTALAGATPPTRPTSLPRPNISSHLAPAILVTILCCMPFGIVAIVQAASVGTKLNAGDVVGAETSSRLARRWCWVAFWSGLAFGALWVGINLLGALAL